MRLTLQRVMRWFSAEGIASLPRWYILLAFPNFLIATYAAQQAVFYLNPGNPPVVNILLGLALAGGGLYPWLLACQHWIAEVLHMIFSRKANRLEVERARDQERAETRKWWEQYGDKFPPDVPPPPAIARNGPGNGAG